MVLQSGVMYYRENDQDTWHPLIIKAQSIDISVLVDSYDPNETRPWLEGEYCLYNDTIWRCITPLNTPAPFDSTKWTETYLSDEIERLGIAVQDTEPATSKVWIDTDDNTTVTCPDISEFNNLADSLGIVVNGSTARAACTAAGQYIILQNSSISGRSDGLYTAAKTFSSGATLDATYFNENAPKTTGGAINDLKNSFAKMYDSGFKNNTSNEQIISDLDGYMFITAMVQISNTSPHKRCINSTTCPLSLLTTGAIASVEVPLIDATGSIVVIYSDGYIYAKVNGNSGWGYRIILHN